VAGDRLAPEIEPAMSTALDSIVNEALWYFLLLCPFPLYDEPARQHSSGKRADEPAFASIGGSK
jgi:hypothetical protein